MLGCAWEGDLGLRGDILKRCEAKAGPRSVLPFGQISKYDDQGCKGSPRGKAYEEKSWVHMVNHCPSLPSRSWSKGGSAGGTHLKASWGFQPAFGKVHSSTPATPHPQRRVGECVEVVTDK